MKILDEDLQTLMHSHWLKQTQKHITEQLEIDWNSRKRKASNLEKIQTLKETLTGLESIWMHTDQYLVEVWNNQTIERKHASRALTLETIEQLIKTVCAEWITQKWITPEELC